MSYISRSDQFADLKIGGDDYKDAYTYILINASNKKQEEKLVKAPISYVYLTGDWANSISQKYASSLFYNIFVVTVFQLFLLAVFVLNSSAAR